MNNVENDEANLRNILIRATSDAFDRYQTQSRPQSTPQRQASLQFYPSNANSNNPQNNNYYGGTRSGTTNSAPDTNTDEALALILSILKRFKYLMYISFVLGALFICSAVFYGILYIWIMPANYAKVPIYFDYYSNECDNPNEIFTKSGTIDSMCPSSSLSSSKDDSAFSIVTGTVDLFSPYTQWYPNPNIVSSTNQIGTPDSPAINGRDIGLNGNTNNGMTGTITTINGHALIPNQNYFLNVVLDLPKSKVNSNVGIFMVHVHLYYFDSTSDSNKQNNYNDHEDKNNDRHFHSYHDDGSKNGNHTLLAYSKRSAMLPYESPMIEFIRKFFLIGPLLMGIFSETKSVEINCFDHFIESQSKPLSLIKIQVIVPIPSQQNDPSTLSNSINPILQISSAELRVGKELGIFQRYMKEWFYSCAFLGIFCIFTIKCILWSIVEIWRRSISATTHYTSHQYFSNPRNDRHGHSTTSNTNSENEQEFQEDEASEMFMNMNYDDNDGNWEDISNENNMDEDEYDSNEDDDDKHEYENLDCDITFTNNEHISLKDSDDDSNIQNVNKKTKKKFMPMKRKISTRKDKDQKKMKAEAEINSKESNSNENSSDENENGESTSTKIPTPTVSIIVEENEDDNVGRTIGLEQLEL